MMRAGSKVVAVLALLGAPAGAFQEGPAKVYQAPDREPTPEETLILEYMNRFRADPSAEADVLAPPGRQMRGVDLKMFRDEMRMLKPMPPLVFNLELLDSARKHAYYMIHNGLGHDEQPGKIGFTGASPGDRVRAAGYRGGGGAENAYRDSGGPLSSHDGFVIDAGPGGPGGMQPGRGHRRNMIGPHREVGPGALPHGKDRLSVIHNFGSRSARMAGGVMYIDLNGNGFYDVGEGAGSVAISSSDGASGASWKSGAYALDLKGQGAVVLTAALDGEKHTKAFAAGPDNVKFDWAVPVEVPLRKADRLLAAVEKAGEKNAQARVNLYVNTRGLYLDAERRKKVAELTAEVGLALEARRKAVADAIESDAAGLQKTIDENRKDYRGTDADRWFEDAETTGKLKRGVAAFLAKPRPTLQERRQLVAALEATAKGMKTPHWISAVEALASKVRENPSEGATR